MRELLGGLLFSLMAIPVPSVHAAWGDISYDPSPAKIDEEQSAQFDAFGFLSYVIASGLGGRSATQNFERGFGNNQVLADWVGLGDNRVRFGFGDRLEGINWRSRIGQADPNASAYGLFHPHGTYGNAPGVTGDPRNYIADHFFLTADFAPGVAAPSYFVMQFEQPIVFVALSFIDYANGVGGSTRFDLLVGDDLTTATALPEYGHRPDQTLESWQLADGSVHHLIGSGALDHAVPSNPNHRPSFNFAVLRLDTPDATVGFDNLIVVNSVAEPGALVLLLAGVSLLGVSLRRRPQ